MSERMRKEVEENNAKPSFFLQSASKASITNQAIYLQGRSTYNEDKGTMSTSLSAPLCYLTEYVANPKEIVALLIKGEMFAELLEAMKAALPYLDDASQHDSREQAGIVEKQFKAIIEKAELLS